MNTPIEQANRFCHSNSIRKAIIQAKEQIIASENDSKLFFEAITVPEKTSQTLRDALADYTAFMKEGN